MFANRLKHSDGERCYERHAAYQMRWDLDALGIPDGGLSSLLSAAAPNGGPLALLGAGAAVDTVSLSTAVDTVSLSTASASWLPLDPTSAAASNCCFSSSLSFASFRKYF